MDRAQLNEVLSNLRAGIADNIARGGRSLQEFVAPAREALYSGADEVAGFAREMGEGTAAALPSRRDVQGVSSSIKDSSSDLYNLAFRLVADVTGQLPTREAMDRVMQEAGSVLQDIVPSQAYVDGSLESLPSVPNLRGMASQLAPSQAYIDGSLESLPSMPDVRGAASQLVPSQAYVDGAVTSLVDRAPDIRGLMGMVGNELLAPAPAPALVADNVPAHHPMSQAQATDALRGLPAQPSVPAPSRAMPPAPLGANEFSSVPASTLDPLPTAQPASPVGAAMAAEPVLQDVAPAILRMADALSNDDKARMIDGMADMLGKLEGDAPAQAQAPSAAGPAKPSDGPDQRTLALAQVYEVAAAHGLVTPEEMPFGQFVSGFNQMKSGGGMDGQMGRLMEKGDAKKAEFTREEAPRKEPKISDMEDQMNRLGGYRNSNLGRTGA